VRSIFDFTKAKILSHLITRQLLNRDPSKLLTKIIEANLILINSLIPERTSPDRKEISVSNPVIRNAHPKDIQELAEILTQSFYSFRGLLSWLYPLLKLGVYEDLRTRINSYNSHYSCLVAISTTVDRESEVAGTVEIAVRSSCFWSANAEQYPYISNLAVKTTNRRQGIARQLLRKCEQIALNWGFSEICLHVLEDNHQAKQLYFTSGYRIKQVEFSLLDYAIARPKRLLLCKHLHSKDLVQNSQLVKHIKYC
jgi:ribosomal protein S18 acetylase RimI-like enzyme